LSSHQPKTAFEKARSRSRQWLRDSERSSGVLRDNFFTRTLARLWCQLCVILFCCCFRPNSKLYTRVRTVLGWTPGREVPSDVLRTEARRNESPYDQARCRPYRTEFGSPNELLC